MATNLDEFADYLLSAESQMGEFEPKPYYECETDSLIFYARDVSSYSKRINKYFTLFLANDGDSFVGLEIKGVKTILRAVEDLEAVDVPLIEPVAVKDEDGEIFDLGVMVRCALVPEPEEALPGQQHEEIGTATRGVRIPRKLCNA